MRINQNLIRPGSVQAGTSGAQVDVGAASAPGRAGQEAARQAVSQSIEDGRKVTEGLRDAQRKFDEVSKRHAFVQKINEKYKFQFDSRRIIDNVRSNLKPGQSYPEELRNALEQRMATALSTVFDPDAKLQLQQALQGSIISEFDKALQVEQRQKAASLQSQIAANAEGIVAGLVRDPETLPAALNQIQELGGALKDAGLPTDTIQSFISQYHSKAEKHAMRANADRYPDQVRDLADSGSLDHLGASEIESLYSRVESSKKKADAQTRQSLQRARTQVKDFQNVDERDLLNMVASHRGTSYEREALQVLQSYKIRQALKGRSSSDLTQLLNENEVNLRQGNISKEEYTIRNEMISSTKKLKDDNKILYYQAYGYNISPLNFQSPDKFTQSLQSRTKVVSEMESIEGGFINPLTESEVEGLKSLYSRSTTNQKVSLLSSLQQFGPSRAGLIAEKLDGKNPILEWALVDQRSPEILATVLKGQDKLNTKTHSLDDTTLSAVRMELDDVLKNSYPDNPFMAQALKKAAMAYMAETNITEGKDALEAVAGIVDLPWFGDNNVIPPLAGMTGDDFEDSIDSITVADLTEYGNGNPVYGNGKAVDLTIDDPDSFTYAVVSPGKYYLTKHGQAIHTEDGEPYVIDLRTRELHRRDPSSKMSPNSPAPPKALPTPLKMAETASSAVDEELLSFIRSEEGFSATAYSDGKKHSIGYGRNTAKAGDRIDRATAEKWLKEDVETMAGHVKGASEKYGLSLTPGQFKGLVSFTYNAGPGNLEKLIEGAKRNQGGRELIDVIKARLPLYNKTYDKSAGTRVTSKVLIKRRAREVRMMNE